jgi:hypothetical protein
MKAGPQGIWARTSIRTDQVRKASREGDGGVGRVSIRTDHIRLAKLRVGSRRQRFDTGGP